MLATEVTFEIRLIERGDRDYLPGYYSLACTAFSQGLEGKRVIALASKELRDLFMSRPYFEEDMEHAALEDLIRTVRRERLRL